MQRISDEVLGVLSTLTVESYGSGALVRITARTIDRKLYLQVDAALRALGGNWSRKAGGHVFTGDPVEAIDAVILARGYLDRQKALGFFETPPNVAQLVHNTLEIRDEGAEVLEPSVGRGALLQGIPWDCSVTAVDVDPVHVHYVEQAYVDTFEGLAVYCSDFLTWKPRNGQRFDAVVMNPPFARGADVDHIVWALRWLKPGGRLVSIMGAGITFRQDAKSKMFRELVASFGGSLEPLPEDSFKASGTRVSTMLLELTKD